MSTIRNPVGPQPPNVYWRRRLLLLIGVVAVIVVILLIVFAPKGDSKAAADKTPSPSPSAKNTQPDPNPSFPSSSAQASAGGTAGTCDPGVVTITPITDASTYAANAQPQLSMSIVNAGAKPCSLDVGTKAQAYIITSGADSIWNSTACQQDPTSDVRTLEPGKTLTTTPFAWNRTRSAESGCAANPTAVTGSGASYHLQVKLGNITSKGTKQFILN